MTTPESNQNCKEPVCGFKVHLYAMFSNHPSSVSYRFCTGKSHDCQVYTLSLQKFSKIPCIYIYIYIINNLNVRHNHNIPYIFQLCLDTLRYVYNVQGNWQTVHTDQIACLGPVWYSSTWFARIFTVIMSVQIFTKANIFCHILYMKLFNYCNSANQK